ncbi:MAG: hypothetical protein AAFO77_04225 [Pseudomonadota bacterium]
MKTLILSAFAMLLATLNAAHAQDLTVTGVIVFEQDAFTAGNLATNDLDTQEPIAMELTFSQSIAPNVSKSNTSVRAGYVISDYTIKIGKFGVSNLGQTSACTLSLTSVFSGTAADRWSLLCRVRSVAQNDFADLTTIRLTMQYPQGTLTDDMVRDPNTFFEPQLYLNQSQGGLVALHDLELYATGPNARARLIGDMIPN